MLHLLSLFHLIDLTPAKTCLDLQPRCRLPAIAREAGAFYQLTACSASRRLGIGAAAPVTGQPRHQPYGPGQEKKKRPPDGSGAPVILWEQNLTCLPEMVYIRRLVAALRSHPTVFKTHKPWNESDLDIRHSCGRLSSGRGPSWPPGPQRMIRLHRLYLTMAGRLYPCAKSFRPLYVTKWQAGPQRA